MMYFALIHQCVIYCAHIYILLLLAGEHLRFCPRDYTCCTSVMEETLVRQSEADFLSSIEEISQFLLTSFTHTHRRFDGEEELFLISLLTHLTVLSSLLII